jgi:hypothetical protein
MGRNASDSMTAEAVNGSISAGVADRGAGLGWRAAGSLAGRMLAALTTAGAAASIGSSGLSQASVAATIAEPATAPAMISAAKWYAPQPLAAGAADDVTAAILASCGCTDSVASSNVAAVWTAGTGAADSGGVSGAAV